MWAVMPFSIMAAAVRSSTASGTGTRTPAGHHPGLGVGAQLAAGIGDPLAGLEPLDPGAHRLDHAGAFGAQRQGEIGQRIEPGALVDVDEVETDRGVPDADLALSGIADVDVFPRENLGPAGFMDTDSFGHVSVSWCWELAGESDKLMERGALEMQERALGLEAAGARVAGHGAVGADHSVARDDDRDGIAPAGAADGAGRRADGRRDVAVGPERAVGNPGHGPADGPLELGAGGRQGEIEDLELAPEIGGELLPGGPEKPGLAAAGV